MNSALYNPVMYHTLRAFGYELLVSETATNTWTGAYREEGSKGGYDPVSDHEFPDAESAKLATCRAVRVVARQDVPTAVDPCIEALHTWSVH
jgi:hypothetical protein